jgi:hypothetical protein
MEEIKAIEKLLVPIDKPNLELIVPKQKPKKPNHDSFRSGFGTENVATVESLIEQGKMDKAEELVKQLTAKKALPEQITEAVADYNGAALVVKFIKSQYKDPEAQKNAALAVLFSFPPMPHTIEAEKLLNTVGSKKLNQERALKIILANREFREIIGCEFHKKPAPIECP